jgi:signal transduction histidine kinase
MYLEAAKGKIVIIEEDSSDTGFISDRVILQRVMINLLKNALEATPEGGSTRVGCSRQGEHVSFRVMNPAVMSREIQLQVFQRSFTTKGRGRGIGTYSIRLLTENYLKGKVGFVSNESEGTVFTITL